jgi:tetratricopeptide (TPR) repeat protein
MTGNRKVYEEAMRAAANVAWEGGWEEAAQAYRRALDEFPDDLDALTGWGMACFKIGRLEEALDAYQRAGEITPDDPTIWERLGQVQEGMGRGKAAAENYMAAADGYLGQGNQDAAVERWQDAVRVDPGNIEAHVALLKRYQQFGQIGQAVEEGLAVARIYRDQGRNAYAIQVCQHTLKLDSHNAEALALLDELRYDESSEKAAKPAADVPAEAPEPLADIGEISDAVALDRGDKGKDVRESPVESARQKALTDLAESVFADEIDIAPAAASRLSKEKVDALIGQAIDFQTRGKVDEAIAAYERVSEAGGERPAVHFNLGLLYQEQMRFDEAIAEFEQSVSHPDYKLGSQFALGECYRARGRVDEALEHFIEVLKIVDLATVRREQADDLIHLYENLADVHVIKGDRELALKFTNSLVTFLSEQGWEDKVKHARERLDALTREGPALSLAEMLVTPGSEKLLESVSLAQEYVKRGMFYAALEECYYSLDSAPYYLPVHRQLAELFLEMRKVDDAVSKFVVIADTYRVRRNLQQATAMYSRALKLTPMNTTVRAKLIDLLISRGEIDQALRNYLILADSYYHQAQMGKAREIYQESLRLAPRGGNEREWTVKILHKMGDIDMQRVDWKRAVSVYERIRDQAPDDERARLTLMELYYRLNQSKSAVNELDELLKIYRERDKSGRVFAILNDVVERWPDAIPLRARLAQAYLNDGRVEDALEHLDKLGDLQLEAGREKEAIATIRAIVALRPPNVEEYEHLLEQLGG